MKLRLFSWKSLHAINLWKKILAYVILWRKQVILQHMYTLFHGHTCQRKMQHGAISNTKTNQHLGQLLKRKWPRHPFPSYTFSQLTGSILMLINTNISLKKVFNTQLCRRKYSAPTYRCALGEACLTLFRSTHLLPPLTLKRMFQTFYGYSMPYFTF